MHTGLALVPSSQPSYLPASVKGSNKSRNLSPSRLSKIVVMVGLMASLPQERLFVEAGRCSKKRRQASQCKANLEKADIVPFQYQHEGCVLSKLLGAQQIENKVQSKNDWFYGQQNHCGNYLLQATSGNFRNEPLIKVAADYDPDSCLLFEDLLTQLEFLPSCSSVNRIQKRSEHDGQEVQPHTVNLKGLSAYSDQSLKQCLEDIATIMQQCQNLIDTKRELDKAWEVEKNQWSGAKVVLVTVASVMGVFIVGSLLACACQS